MFFKIILNVIEEVVSSKCLNVNICTASVVVNSSVGIVPRLFFYQDEKNINYIWLL